MRLSEIKIGSEYQLNRDYNSTFPKGSIIKVTSKCYSSVYFNDGKFATSAESLVKIDNTKLFITRKITEKKERNC